MAPKSAKKPRGTHKAYIAAVHWLREEFTSKLIMTKCWEDMKIMINHYAPPDDVSSLSEVTCGINEESAECAVQMANSKHWGVIVNKREYVPADVVTVGKEIVAAFYDTIKSRMDKYLKDNAIVPVPKKRARLDTEQPRVDLLPVMEDVTLLPIAEVEEGEAEEHGEDNHDDKPTENDAEPSVNEEKKRTWGEVQEEEENEADDGQDEDVSVIDPSTQPYSTVISDLTSKVTMLEDYIKKQNKEIYRIVHTVYEPHIIYIDNLVAKDGKETQKSLKETVTMILTDIDFKKTAKQVLAAWRVTDFRVAVRIMDFHAVAHIIDNANRFNPAYWASNKQGGKFVVANMGKLRSMAMDKYNKMKPRWAIKAGGWLYVSRMPRGAQNVPRIEDNKGGGASSWA